MLVDFDTYSESDESNNFAYYTYENGDPIHIVNGVIQNAPAKKLELTKSVPQKNDPGDMQTVRTEHNKNAYTTREIAQKLMYDKKTGKLQQKIYEYLAKNPTKAKRQYKN